MGSVYDDYYKQAYDLQNHFHDVVDDQNHPQAVSLHNEMTQLTEDFKAEKDPHHMEDRLKVIDHELLQARSQGEQIMSYRDIDDLQHRYNRLRESVRQLPNY